MKPITREELDRWKQLAEAATEGPWEVVEYEAGVFIMFSDGFDSSSMGTGDARFIAAARDAVPRLVAEVERLRGSLKKLTQCDHDWVYLCAEQIMEPIFKCQKCGGTRGRRETLWARRGPALAGR
jgi:hypothetical protein